LYLATTMIIRPATPLDAHAIAEAHVASWQQAYRDLLPAEFLASLSITDRETLWTGSIAKKTPILVAIIDGELAGFIAIGPSRDQDAVPTTWEIWALYCSPDFWGQGVGRALWLAAREAVLAFGAKTVSLWVIVGNQRAMRFYQQAGFVIEPGAPLTFELGGATLEEIRMLHAVQA
jgi:GNAT superfamily N-acetyltransferase